MMTTWTEDSEVSRINAAAGGKAVKVSDETFAVIARAQEIVDFRATITVDAINKAIANRGTLPAPPRR